MTEWHVTPDYIINNWTNELLDLMVGKLMERLDRRESRIQENVPSSDENVSEELFKSKISNSNLIKWETKRGD